MANLAGVLNKYTFTYTTGSRVIYAANFEDAMSQLFNCSDGTNANGLDVSIVGAGSIGNFQESGPTTAGTKVSNGAGRAGSLTGITLP